MKIRNLTKVSICIAIICISSYIAFPLPFTPIMITAQTIAINITALILKPKESFLAVAVYIFLGIFGLPVFSGGTSGLGKLLGPTGGFIIGFLIVAPLISYLKGKNNNFKRYLTITILVGMIFLYAIGSIYMSMIQNIGIISALSLAVFPFIIGDFFKCFFSVIIAIKLNKVIE